MRTALKLLIPGWLLVSCAISPSGVRTPSSKLFSNSSCQTILTQVRRLTALSDNKSMKSELRLQLWDFLNENNNTQKIDSYIDLIKLNFNQEELNLITTGLHQAELFSDRMNYLIWAGGLSPKRRKRALSEISMWDNSDETKELKKFLKARAKFDKWESKKFTQLLSEAGEDADVQTLKLNAKVQRESYERLKYACSAKMPNTDNAAAGKNFRRFILTVGPMSVLAGYTVANWSELQQAWREMQEGEGKALKGWFKQLGYDLSIGIILNYTIGRIFSEPTGSYFQKVVKGYGADLAIGSADMFAYNIIFPSDQEEIQTRFEALKKEPDFEAKMKLLQKQLDAVGFVVKFKASLMSTLKGLIEKGEPLVLPQTGLLSISQADLERPEIQRLVIKALTAQLYEEGRYGAEPPQAAESIIHTGEGGSDRLLFYAGVGPLYHTVNIAIGTKIYQTICMGKNNLSQAFAKAALMHTAWAFSYNMFEFPLRSRLINQ